MPGPVVIPFRWDIGRRESLGRLLDGPVAETYDGFRDDLRACAAAVLARAGDSDLFFVGRSPETLFDYLSGALMDTGWRRRAHLLQFSFRDDPVLISGRNPSAMAGVRGYFESLDLDPAAIRLERRLAFIDLVSSGATFGSLTRLLEQWSRELGLEWREVHRKFRYVGITGRETPSPKTWRWQQNQEWVDSVPEARIINVAIDWRLWGYLGNWQDKTTHSYGHWRWGQDRSAVPPRDKEQLAALRLAVRVFDAGRTKAERKRLAAELARQREMREDWLRSLVLDLRGRR